MNLLNTEFAWDQKIVPDTYKICSQQSLTAKVELGSLSVNWRVERLQGDQD